MYQPKEPHQELSDYPVVIEVPVHWGELDAYGHVNNAHFFRFFESARMAYLDRCGFLRSYEDDKVGAILHTTTCRFRRPLFHPDLIQIGARVMDVREDRFTMAYRIVSLEQGCVAAEGDGIIVAYDYQRMGKTSLPPKVRQGIEELESDRS